MNQTFILYLIFAHQAIIHVAGLNLITRSKPGNGTINRRM